MSMSRRTRKKGYKRGSLKGWVFLALLIIGALYFGQGRERQGWINQTLQETVGKISARNSNEKEPETGLQLEIPIPESGKEDKIILKRTGFTLAYDNFHKTPRWVAWELTRRETEGAASREDKFEPDPDLPEPRVTHRDYTGSGYDRGHMAPAADMKWSTQAMKESFYMSNVCPQNRKLNRDDWGDLEEACRQWARRYGSVYIACGPIYGSGRPPRIGEHGVAVPDGFFKVVLINKPQNPVAMGFLFKNEAHHQPLHNYQVTVDEVEHITALDFFAGLPDRIENRIEAALPPLPPTGNASR